MECQHCHHTYQDETHPLCPACDLALTLDPLRLCVWLDPLHASLDATVHPGGHQPTRVNLPNAPTPIRLDVLDLLDTIDATARAMWRRLEGVDALDWRRDAPAATSLRRLLMDISGHPRLTLLADAGMWLDSLDRLCALTLAIIDIPDRPKPIGHCPNPLCGVQLNAIDGQGKVTCPVCGGEWHVADVRLALLESLAGSERLLTLTECARLLGECGYHVTRKQLQHRRDRGLLTPQTNDSKGRQLFRVRDVMATLPARFDAAPGWRR